mgnify:FL=1
MALLEVNNLSVFFGGIKAVQNVSFQAEKGEFIGLIGPNGAGKTTVFNAVTGVAKPTEGEILFDGKRIGGMRPDKIAHLGIARTFQNIRIYPKLTAWENVLIGIASVPKYDTISAMLRLPHVVKSDREARQECEMYLNQIGLSEYKDVQAGSLPYGIQRKLEIARALATKPKLLFLDEPAAGMNTKESAELVDFLKQIHQMTGITIILIEHHMDVVMNVCSKINVLNLGELLFTGTPQEVQTNPEVIRAYIGERRKSHA